MRTLQPGHRRLAIGAIATAALAFPLGVVASHQFTDVPNTNTFHADIDALADAGVTTGCGPGIYCPKDFVTREQMAAFLNRLGALGPGKAPVVNAAKVDGLDSTSFSRLAYGIATSTVSITYPGPTTYGTLQLTAPMAGYVVVDSSITVFNQTCSSWCDVYAVVRHVETGDASVEAREFIYGTHASLSTTSVFDVEAGVNTFRIELTRSQLANAALFAFKSELTAQFSPFAEG